MQEVRNLIRSIRRCWNRIDSISDAGIECDFKSSSPFKFYGGFLRNATRLTENFDPFYLRYNNPIN